MPINHLWDARGQGDREEERWRPGIDAHRCTTRQNEESPFFIRWLAFLFQFVCRHPPSSAAFHSALSSTSSKQRGKKVGNKKLTSRGASDRHVSFPPWPRGIGVESAVSPSPTRDEHTGLAFAETADLRRTHQHANIFTRQLNQARLGVCVCVCGGETWRWTVQLFYF